jgi:hypothetical protein
LGHVGETFSEFKGFEFDPRQRRCIGDHYGEKRGIWYEVPHFTGGNEKSEIIIGQAIPRPGFESVL